MRFGRLLPALSVFVAAGALIVLTGTGAAAPQPGRSAPAAITANLAAPAALDATLRSLGVNRASLVTQRGARNYAGPNCPGKGWNCTTSTRVLQIATIFGQNRVECPNNSDISTSLSQSCDVTQNGSTNVAWCYQRTDSSTADQKCIIDQTGKRNVAYVKQHVHASGSDPQSATQTAHVTQRPKLGQGANWSFIDQWVTQSTRGGDEGEDEDEDEDEDEGPPAAEQKQDAHQSAEVDQSAAGSGDNYSRVTQRERLSAKHAFEQYQNTDGSPLSDCVSGFPFDPNACANIDQRAKNGDNTSHLQQSIRESAKTNAVAVQQTQGSSSGGLDAKVHQDIESLVNGTSKSNADQSKRQDMVAAPDTEASSQDQFDPIRCCGNASQEGGTGNSEDIDQSSTQAASEDFANQALALLGESYSPQGRCSVSQEARNNSDSTPNSGECVPPEAPLVVLTTCENGGEGGSCTPNPDGCSPFCDFDFSDLVFAKPSG